MTSDLVCRMDMAWASSPQDPGDPSPWSSGDPLSHGHAEPLHEDSIMYPV